MEALIGGLNRLLYFYFQFKIERNICNLVLLVFSLVQQKPGTRIGWTSIIGIRSIMQKFTAVKKQKKPWNVMDFPCRLDGDRSEVSSLAEQAKLFFCWKNYQSKNVCENRMFHKKYSYNQQSLWFFFFVKMFIPCWQVVQYHLGRPCPQLEVDKVEEISSLQVLSIVSIFLPKIS